MLLVVFVQRSRQSTLRVRDPLMRDRSCFVSVQIYNIFVDCYFEVYIFAAQRLSITAPCTVVERSDFFWAAKDFCYYVRMHLPRVYRCFFLGMMKVNIFGARKHQ